MAAVLIVWNVMVPKPVFVIRILNVDTWQTDIFHKNWTTIFKYVILANMITRRTMKIRELFFHVGQEPEMGNNVTILNSI